MIDLSIIRTTECTCETCQRMCAHTPCWPTPEEAMRLLDEGYADRMMVVAQWGVLVVAPAANGFEGVLSEPWEFRGKGCVLFKDGRCEIHHMKPIEGRMATCDDERPTYERDQLAELWGGGAGAAVVKRLCEFNSKHQHADAE